MTGRIERRFAELKQKGRAALVTFVTAGDPDYETSLKIIKGLPKAGADIIEFGMPFTDPMADGPAIQAAGLRALHGGQTLKKTLKLVKAFRAGDKETPVVLMGYYNPIYVYGVEKFLVDAKAAGVDGLIVVDLPPEEDDELCLPAMKAGLNFIRLATPTTDDKRAPAVFKNTSGFVYYVSVLGITGTKAPDLKSVAKNVNRLRKHTNLPIAVGFGVKTAEQARAIAKSADGVVVGSALVSAIKDNLTKSGTAFTKDRESCTLAGKQYCPWRKELDQLNWIKNFVRPKIRSILGVKRDVPENMWIKDPESGQMVFYRDLEANQFVFPGSGHHHRLAPDLRLKSMFDDGEYETVEFPAVPADPLKFRDERKYVDRLKEARQKANSDDAIHAGFGTIDQLPIVIAIQDMGFIAGSLGTAAGEAIITAMRSGRFQEMPVCIFCGLRGSPHAGRHSVPHADAAHNCHGAGAARP